MISCLMKPVYCFIAGSLVLASQLAVAGGNTGNKDNNLTALGKAPDWNLVVDNTTHQVTFTSAEGVVSYRYPAEGPTLIRTEKACLDAETGKSYETTVVVVFDGKSYHGCGNYEHQSHM